jgi:hypothetical protein
MSTEWIDGIAVFLIGVLVGGGELVSHYRDEPFRALRSTPAAAYLVINGGASLFALVALRTFGWVPSGASTDEALRLTQILAAGFGAMAIFRSALFVVRVGNDDVGVGPIAFLTVILKAVDRGVDRKRASDREKSVVDIMQGLAYDNVKTSLPAFAAQLMQNLSLQDVAELGKAVQETADPKLPENTRTLNLGLVLMDAVGESVLRDAVRGLKVQSGQASPAHAGFRLFGGPKPAATTNPASAAGSTNPATVADPATPASAADPAPPAPDPAGPPTSVTIATTQPAEPSPTEAIDDQPAPTLPVTPEMSAPITRPRRRVRPPRSPGR